MYRHMDLDPYFICLSTMKLYFICVLTSHICQKLWYMLENNSKQNGNTSPCHQVVQCLMRDTVSRQIIL